jgi:hypothetical protein
MRAERDSPGLDAAAAAAPALVACAWVLAAGSASSQSMLSHNSGAAWAPIVQLIGLAIVALTALAAMSVMLAWIWRVVSRRPEDDFEDSSIGETPDPVVEEPTQ